MPTRDALSRVLLTYENNLKYTDDDGKVARARVLERVIQGKLESGTDSGEANRAFFDERAIAHAANYDLELAAVFDRLNLEQDIAEVVTLIIYHAGTGGRLEVQPTSPAAPLAWAPRLTVANGGALRPGGAVCLHQPAADALPVEPGIAETLRLRAIGGGVTARVYYLGRDLEISETSASSQSTSLSSQSSVSSSSTSQTSLSSSSSSQTSLSNSSQSSSSTSSVSSPSSLSTPSSTRSWTSASSLSTTSLSSQTSTRSWTSASSVSSESSSTEQEYFT